MLEERLRAAPTRERGNCYEDFTPGRVFDHHWARTVDPADNMIFTTATLHFNPLYFSLEHARADGHPGIVANPMLAFAIVFGLSVEDLSERGGAFLGLDDLVFHAPSIRAIRSPRARPWSAGGNRRATPPLESSPGTPKASTSIG